MGNSQKKDVAKSDDESEMIRLVAENKNLKRELKLRREISRAIGANLPSDRLIQNILNILVEGFGATGGAVYFMDVDRDELTVKATTNFKREYAVKYQKIHLGSNLSGRVAQTGEGILIRDSTSDNRSTDNVVKILEYKSAVVTPVTSKGEVIGIIALISKFKNFFSEKDLKLMEFISDHISLTIDNSMLNERIARERETTFDILQRVDEGIFEIELRDPINKQSADLVDSLIEEGRIRLVNSSFSNQAGKELVVGDPVGEAFEEKQLRTLLEELAQRGESNGIERRFFGEMERFYDVSMVMISDGDDIRGFKGIRRDVTDRMKMEEEIKKSKQETELFMDYLTHDVSNINTAVLGFLELVSNRQDLPDDVDEYIIRSIDAVTKSSDLIRKIITLSKTQKGPQALVKTDIHSVIRRVFDMVNMENPSVEINVDDQMDHEEIIVECDELIDDLFHLVITNGIKEVKEGRVDYEINYREWEYGDRYGYLVCLTNDIPSDVGETETIDKAPSGKDYDGINVSIMKGLARRYDGKLWIQNREKGESESGQRYMLFFPWTPGS